MKTNHTTTENFNDLVFENRNKAYGAYAIRNSYSDNVSKSLFIMLALTGSLLLIAFWFNKTDKAIPDIKGQVPEVPKIYSIPIALTPPAPEPKTPEPEQPKESKPISTNTAYLASDNEKDVSTTTNENATINKEGTPDGTDSSAFIEPGENRGTIVVAAPPSNTPVAAPDVFPEFNGDLFKFLRSKIQYPYMAMDNGTSGTVNVQFVVEKDGSINDIKVLHAVADGCTEEAVRVIKSMPKWKPGRNRGEPVRVLYNLPVKFTLK